jgi:hypothetical protein
MPPEIREAVLSMPELKTKFSITRLKNELYASPDIKIHSFLRELYFENPYQPHQYLLLLKKIGKY